MITPETLIFPVSGLVAGVVVWRAGCLRASALDRAPSREGMLGGLDLVAGLLLMYLGMIAAQGVLEQMGLWATPLEGVGGEGVSPALPVETGPGGTPFSYLQEALVGQGLVQLPVVLFVWWRCSDRIRGLGMWSGHLVRDGIAGLLGLIVALPMALGLGVVVALGGQWLLGEPAPEMGHELLGLLKEPAPVWVTLGLLASAVLIAPVFEEVIFRGLVQTGLLGLFGSRRWVVVLVASLVFTLMHTGQAWQVLPSLFVLAVVLGWLYERTGSLLPPVLVHVGFNAINIALAVQ